MNISIKWCLDNLSKAYNIHYFEGSIEQFKEVLIKADEAGIIYTRDISDSLIEEIILKSEL
jgi:hypothetical protein